MVKATTGDRPRIVYLGSGVMKIKRYGWDVEKRGVGGEKKLVSSWLDFRKLEGVQPLTWAGAMSVFVLEHPENEKAQLAYDKTHVAIEGGEIDGEVQQPCRPWLRGEIWTEQWKRNELYEADVKNNSTYRRSSILMYCDLTFKTEAKGKDRDAYVKHATGVFAARKTLECEIAAKNRKLDEAAKADAEAANAGG